MRIHCFIAAALLVSAAAAGAEPPAVFGPADPRVKDAAHFDVRRPIAQELQTDVPDGFTVGAVGDLIISRPLSQYSQRIPGFKSVLDILRGTDALYGNLETTISMPDISRARLIPGMGIGPTPACRPWPGICGPWDSASSPGRTIIRWTGAWKGCGKPAACWMKPA